MPSIREIADRIGARIEGDESLILEAIKPLESAGPGDLSFLTNPAYRSRAISSRAGAILTDEGTTIPGRTLLRHRSPYRALGECISLFHPQERIAPGVRPGAQVDPGADVDAGAIVLEGAFIGADVAIGPGSVIHPGTVIQGPAHVGKGCRIDANVTIYPRVSIGDRVEIQAGTVVGSSGFGYAFDEGRHHPIPQVGGVEIADDVHIGAGCTIDAGTLTPTTIGEGTRIDNLVQIAHNVKIGRHCILVAMVGISGSTRIGDYCVFAGQSGAVGHLTIGNHVTVTAKTGVTADVPDGATVSGFPSGDHHSWLRQQAALRRLPRFLKILQGGDDGTED